MLFSLASYGLAGICRMHSNVFVSVSRWKYVRRSWKQLDRSSMVKLKQLGLRERSRRQEEVCASRVGGKPQPGSGSRDHSKLDVEAPGLMVECKFTDGKGFRVTKALLEKVRRESAMQGKTGIVELDIDGTLCWIVPENVLEVYVENVQ